MDLSEKVIWRTELTWEDLVNHLEDEEIEIFDSLSDDEQMKIIETYTNEIRNGLQSGLMHDWEYVMDVAITCTDISDVLKEKKAKKDVNNLTKAKEYLEKTKDALSSLTEDLIIEFAEKSNEYNFLANFDWDIDSCIKELTKATEFIENMNTDNDDEHGE